MIIKIIVSIFVLLVISRTYLRFKEGSINLFSLFLWNILWATIAFFVWWPGLSSSIAGMAGVGRGVDFFIYISIVVIFYAIFRIFLKLEFIEREITQIVRKLALGKDDSQIKKDKE